MKKYLTWLGLVTLVFIFTVTFTHNKIGLAATQVKPVEKYLAPDFTLSDLSGKNVSLNQVVSKNKLTIVNFWATWCPPCRAEIPELIEFYKKYKSKGIEILAINLQEEPAQVKMFAQTAGMLFPVLTDISGKVAANYQVFAIPTTFAVDKSGKIVWILRGSTDFGTLETKTKNL